MSILKDVAMNCLHEFFEFAGNFPSLKYFIQPAKTFSLLNITVYKSNYDENVIF